MIITTKKRFDEVKNIIGLYVKVTNNFYIGRLYGNKKLHPIGYYIPVLIFIKK